LARQTSGTARWMSCWVMNTNMGGPDGRSAGSLAPARLTEMDSDYAPNEVAELLLGAEVQLIDVRENDEFEAGRIAGARHIPMAQLPAEVAGLDRERPIVFYCRSGSRSAMATEAFRGAGFNAHNMAGGLLDWEAAGLPLEPADGRVAGG
jgi:rhodanese-related sulfurtransferase